MKVRRPYAFCCIEGGGRVSGCLCSNPDHGFAIVDVRSPLPGDEIIPTPNDTPPSGFVELKALYDSQTWAKDWQHNVVPPGKPAQELACAAIRALPELFRLAALTTAPTTGVVDCLICHNNGSDCQACVGGAMTTEQAAEWLRAQAIATAPTAPADREAECKPQNRCCVSGWPAGHPFACNDCDPCLFGSHPSEWCPTCGGDQWINDRPCYNCDGSGFRQRLNDACQVRETSR